MKEIRHGEVYWLDFGPSSGSTPAERHPCVVVQSDVFNRSRIATTVVCLITFNLDRAARNFQAALIHDAGAECFWPGGAHQSLLNVNFEVVHDRAQETDRRVYAFDRNIDSQRRIPYANQSLHKPDVLLADLIAVFHPGMLPDHKFGFLREVRSSKN